MSGSQFQGAAELPHSIDAEVAVLGGMVLRPEASAIVCRVLDETDFYRPAHQILFLAIRDRWSAGEGVDLVVLRNDLLAAGTLDRVGGLEYLTQLADAVPTSANTGYYAEIVAGLSAKRRLFQVAESIAAAARNGKAAEVTAHDAARAIAGISARLARGNPAPTFADVGRSAWAILTAEIDGSGSSPLLTGWHEIDATVRMKRGSLIVIGGRPGMGKSVCTMNIALRAAVEGRRVLYYALETTAQELYWNAISRHAHVSREKIQRCSVTEEELTRCLLSAQEIANLPLDVREVAETSDDLVASARAEATESNISLVVVDYLQLLGMRSGARQSRREAVDEASRSLKMLGKELDCPVIVVSQLSREGEREADPRPKLHHLRESGQIEQDADSVWLLYRPEYYKPTDEVAPEDRNVLQVGIAKNRLGPTRGVRLACFLDHMAIENLALPGQAAAAPAHWQERT